MPPDVATVLQRHGRRGAVGRVPGEFVQSGDLRSPRREGVELRLRNEARPRGQRLIQHGRGHRVERGHPRFIAALLADSHRHVPGTAWFRSTSTRYLRNSLSYVLKRWP